MIFERVKILGENLNDRNVIVNDNVDAEMDFLKIYNSEKELLINITVSEILADCNSASITKSECHITDSAIIITKYFFRTGQCVECSIGFTEEKYSLNQNGKLEVLRAVNMICSNSEIKK